MFRSSIIKVLSEVFRRVVFIMPFDNLINSNQVIPVMKKWCDNVTIPYCPVDCGDILDIIRSSWHNRHMPTFLVMLILIVSFVHLILFLSPILLKCVLKSFRDSHMSAECSSIGLSTEILQPQTSSTPLTNNLLSRQLSQKSIASKLSSEKSQLLSNELENKANKISAAADALFKSTCLTYINSTCVLNKSLKRTNSSDPKNESVTEDDSKVKNTNQLLNIRALIAREIENLKFRPEKPTKNWQRELKTAGREHMVLEIIRSRLSKSDPKFWVGVDVMDDVVTFGEVLHPVEILARQDECKIYESAESKTQYFNRIYSLCQQIHDKQI